MIHNISKVRKRENTLTEEELERLIGTVEEQELLHAPGHLKSNVLWQIQAEKVRKKERALFSYRAKVLAGMAAALTVLFLVPVDGTETEKPPRTGILETLRGDEIQDAGEIDEWEQDSMERQRDIEETWERYRKDQERADARRQYFREFAEKMKDYKEWED